MTDEELNARLDAINVEIKTEGVVTRRHFDVVAEGLKAEIKIIAEGHDALRQDVTDLKAGQQRLEAGQERLEIRQLALEHRQGRVEGRLEAVEGAQRRVEARLEGVEGSQNDLVTEVRLLAARLPA